MTSLSEVPLKGQQFDEFIEIAVDGTSVFRIEQVPEANLSASADAAIALFQRSLRTDIEEEIEHTYGESIEEIIHIKTPT